MKWRSTGKVSILVVPEKEGASFSFKASLLVVRLALLFASLALVFFIVMAFSWNNLLKKASIYDKLAEENQELLKEHTRLVALQDRVDQLQKLEAQIRRVLGVDQSGGRETPTPVSIYSDSERESPATKISGSVLTVQPPLGEAVPEYDRSRYTAQAIWKEVDVPSLWPVAGFISRQFETDSVVPDLSHYGVDLAAAEGTVIKATTGGLVIWSGWSPFYGNTIILAHAANYFSFYGHCQRLLVQIRQRVERGEPIGFVGNTGQSSAPHLHFEIWHGNVPQDPTNLLMPK